MVIVTYDSPFLLNVHHFRYPKYSQMFTEFMIGFFIHQ